MRAVKGFAKTCFSESLIAESSGADGDEGGVGEGGTSEENEVLYHGGLGLKFKFPGDPKKYVCYRSFSYSRPLSQYRTQATRSIKAQVMDNLSKRYAF